MGGQQRLAEILESRMNYIRRYGQEPNYLLVSNECYKELRTELNTLSSIKLVQFEKYAIILNMKIIEVPLILLEAPYRLGVLSQ